METNMTYCCCGFKFLHCRKLVVRWRKDHQKEMVESTNNNNPTTHTSSSQSDPHTRQSFRYQVEEDIHNLPNVRSWFNRPIYLQANEEDTNCPGDSSTLPLGTSIDFESNLFRGKVLIRVRNVTSNVPKDHSSYFNGRRRLKQFIVQGTFKEALKMSDVHFGDIYGKPLKMSSVVHFVVPLLRKVIPGVVMDLSSDNPKILVLMAGEAKMMSVNHPGSEPDIADPNLMEDVNLLGFKSVKERKKALGTPRTASKYKFDPDLVYTMEFYDDVIDIEAYSVRIPMLGNVCLKPYLDMQPFNFAALTIDDKFLFQFRVYHEALVGYKENNVDDDEQVDSWEDDDKEAIRSMKEGATENR